MAPRKQKKQTQVSAEERAKNADQKKEVVQKWLITFKHGKKDADGDDVSVSGNTVASSTAE